MTDFQDRALADLLKKLEEVLGRDSILYHRFERGLMRESESRLSEAMDCLKLYPVAIRREVENTVMTWLFGNKGERPAFGRRKSTPSQGA